MVKIKIKERRKEKIRKNYKPLIIGILCTLIVFMAVGFALLSQELTITGTSSIDSNWNIRITNIRVKNLTSAYGSGSNVSADVSGSTGCTTQTAPCNSTEANFEASLITPGDYIVYEVTITNSGSLDGVVSSINLTCTENIAITCTTTGLAQADTIAKNGGTNTVDVKVEYNSATESQPANTSVNATLTINYQQDLGQVSPPAPSYDYAIGDTITYKDTTWRVIKNSTASEDYVTLMKTTVLTNAELGEYGYSLVCTEANRYQGDSCTEVGQVIGFDAAKFDKTSPYSNDYATSNVKAAVEAYMTSKEMANDLKEVDGYKVRLVTYDELIGNLGYDPNHNSAGPGTAILATENVPQWIYTNFGDVFGYWTMTAV